LKLTTLLVKKTVLALFEDHYWLVQSTHSGHINHRDHGEFYTESTEKKLSVCSASISLCALSG